jgi:hypothetical protein
VALLKQAAEGLGGEAQNTLGSMQSRFLERNASIERFVAAYRQYCWPVE